jgi:hypothetical protein
MKNRIFFAMKVSAGLLLLFFATQAFADNTTLTVKAKGSKAHGVYSHFEVYVNGMKCGDKYTDMDFEEYCFPVPFSKSEIKEVKVVFTNDVYSMGEDRNLCVFGILIDGEIPIKANRQNATYVCQNGDKVPYCGMMQWNGTLIFDVADLRIHPGDVTLRTQEEVNVFNQQYVEGSLTISGEDIVDLAPLSGLASVKKALIIENNPRLVNIRGLNNLLEAGFISIEKNDRLENIDGFDSLERRGGMYIRENGVLNSLKCFESLGI